MSLEELIQQCGNKLCMLYPVLSYGEIEYWSADSLSGNRYNGHTPIEAIEKLLKGEYEN